MARRRNGSGAVKRRSDGRWEGQLRLGDGRRQSVYASTRADVVARLREERWRQLAGIPRPSSGLRVGLYLEEWLEVCRPRLRPSTFQAYRLCVDRVLPQLAAVPLTRLTPFMLQGVYSRLEAAGLAPRTVFQTHAVLHRAFKQALGWGLLRSIRPTWSRRRGHLAER